MAKQDEWTRLTVRIPPELYERIQAAVTAGPNSMNAEIVSRLEGSFDRTNISSVEINQSMAATSFALLKILSLFNEVPGMDMKTALSHLEGRFREMLPSDPNTAKIIDIFDKGLNFSDLQNFMDKNKT